MVNNISKEKVMEIADMARLHLTEEEAEKLTSDLTSIINHAESLTEVDTSEVEPTTHAIQLENVMRDDEPKRTATQEDVLKNAPDHKDGEFSVPSILDE